MIILYDEKETKFDNLGIGVLKDSMSCYVKEILNDSFELELVYPINGQYYSEIKINSIILAKPNPYSDYQPFRISDISKPINGLVAIKAYHISYDMNGIIVGPISANTLNETLHSLETNSILEHNFKFSSDANINKTFKTSNYYNLRSLLFGSNESILETYKLEIVFDKFNVSLVKQRGSDKNAEIRYGKNMTDLKHEFSCELLYNYVYPYYHLEQTSSSVSVTNDGFKKAYIVGPKPLQDGWLSFEENGEPYHPVDEAPIQIETQGDYYNKVFTWDTNKQRYIERLYDQQVTLVDGVIAPDWIEIDWRSIPSIVVKAKKDGYFKMITDTEYKHYNIGDIVFSGSIRTALTSSLVLFYSEVIPPTSAQLENESTSTTHVELTNKVLKVDTKLANKMKFNRILKLDLTDEFEEGEEPNDKTLTEKALKYIKENKIGEYKYNTSVSFVDLSSSNDDIIYKNLDKIELGDTIRIIYDLLGVDVDLRVISTTYDVLLDKYSKIELGEKSDTISSSSVQTGDSISSLSNDKGYATEQKVSEIIAKTVTADYLEAVNAKLSKAQIEDLQSARIKCTGMLEALQIEVDKLVAKMLVADNAVIKKTLEAGTVKVSGDITVKSGEITIQNDLNNTVFKVDRDGNLYANSATIEGKISASEGKIGGFVINQTSIYNNIDSMYSDSDSGVYIGPDGISLGKQLKIFPDGLITSYNVNGNLTSYALAIPGDIRTPSKNMKTSSAYVFGGDLIGSRTVDEISNLSSSDVSVGYTFNVEDAGIINGLELVSGDNIIITGIDGNTINYRKLILDEFNGAYNYVGEASIEDIEGLLNILNANEYSTNRIYTVGQVCKHDNNYYVCNHFTTGTWKSQHWDQIEPREFNSGDIYRILESRQTATAEEYDETITYPKDSVCIHEGTYYKCNQDGTTGTWDSSKWDELDIDSLYYMNNLINSEGDPVKVNIGDYIVYLDNLDGSNDHHWNIFYYSDSLVNYFGITPDGILYANGAVISGDITVKSGEISIENGSTVFRVDRDGKITATAGNIAGYEIDTISMHKGNIGDDKSVWMSTGKTATILSLDSNQKTWAFTASDTFGVTTSGELYCVSGKIGGITITSSGIGLTGSGYLDYTFVGPNAIITPTITINKKIIFHNLTTDEGIKTILNSGQTVYYKKSQGGSPTYAITNFINVPEVREIYNTSGELGGLRGPKIIFVHGKGNDSTAFSISSNSTVNLDMRNYIANLNSIIYAQLIIVSEYTESGNINYYARNYIGSASTPYVEISFGDLLANSGDHPDPANKFIRVRNHGATTYQFVLLVIATTYNDYDID